MRDLQKVLTDFQLGNPGTRHQRWSIGRCGEISLVLAIELYRERIDHQIILLRGWRGEVHETCRPEWADRPSSWKHYVVCVDGQTYDFTFRQFDKTADWPRVVPLRRLTEEWKSVTPIGNSTQILLQIEKGKKW